MEKNHPYCLSSTGIRIPRHKVKWMLPPQEESSGESPFPLRHTDKPPFNLLLINHLHIHTNEKFALVSGRIVEAEDREECSSNDV